MNIYISEVSGQCIRFDDPSTLLFYLIFAKMSTLTVGQEKVLTGSSDHFCTSNVSK